MPRLSQAHDRARRRINDLAGAGLSSTRLTIQIADTLQEAIGWDGFRMFGLDQRTLLINKLLGASENDADARLEWLREVYLAIPTQYAELPELARAGLRGVAFQERQEQCWGYSPKLLAGMDPQEHYRHYHEYRSPVGGSLLAVFRDQDRPVAAMQAYRRESNRQFRATDVSFLQQMSPVIGSALAAASAREQATLAPTVESSSASGILLVGDHGDVRFATPAGEQWLDALGTRDGGLPPSVWATMAALRNARSGPAASVTVQTDSGKARIEASASGQPGVTAIVIAAELPPPTPDVPASWGLTPQERSIVEQLAAGKSNAQIAAALFVSDNTVEWHLRSVYDKLGVHSRQEVMAALFRQTMLPSIERDVRSPG
jgi:DNA-binding CsgD family transcriptional regulator